jgi:solute carrier family 30 (zinc transporter), member 5/7
MRYLEDNLLTLYSLVSVEIIFDAMHRLHEGYELKRLNELLIVSILGFLVNIIGLTAFGHAHHGHGRSHSHSHDHFHDRFHDQSHSHSSEKHQLDSHDHSHAHYKHGHAHSNSHLSPVSPVLPTPTTPSHSHHAHTNENMEGIFLHIVADALGSVAVIISTLLTKYNSWSGWDPLASCAIAILIFLSAIPLVKSSGLKLLLSLEDDAEYRCRGVLQGISELRGVVGYAGVRFWCADEGDGDQHSHHGHAHGHEKHDHREGHMQKASIQGVIHIIANKAADLDDVRERTELYLRSRGYDVLVHVERQGEGRCWCGGGLKST